MVLVWVAIVTNVAASVLMVLHGRVRSARILRQSGLVLYAVSAVLMLVGAVGFESVTAKVAVALSAVSTALMVWTIAGRERRGRAQVSGSNVRCGI